MTNVTLYKQDGSRKMATLTLNDAIWAVEPNENVVFDAVVMQRASIRQGTHAVKNRSARRGGGRKPWRQKGTGRARQGSIRSARNGVKVGLSSDQPRVHMHTSCQRRFVRLAIKSVLSQKVSIASLVVVDSLNFDAPKTKAFATVLNNLKVRYKTLVVLEDGQRKVAAKAARNLPNVKDVPAEVYQRLRRCRLHRN
jgi:large subunit ribosomal protein L4